MRFALLTIFLALGGCASNSDVIVGSATMPAPDPAAAGATEAPPAASPVAATPTPSQTTGATAAR